MKPDPSIRMTCWVVSSVAAGSTCSRMSVSAGVAGSFVQHIEARAVGAQHRTVGDVQEHARMAECRVAAVAGHCAVVHVDDLGRGGGGAIHGTASHPLWRGGGGM